MPWNDAVRFCTKLSEKTKKTVRLPTEAEWEFACRAGDVHRIFLHRANPADYAWFADNAEKKTHPVGQKKAQSSGGCMICTAMSGSGANDWYDERYYAKAKAG